MERNNGDFITEDAGEAIRIGKEEGRDWIYVRSSAGYDGYCAKEDCNCQGHIHYGEGEKV